MNQLAFKIDQGIFPPAGLYGEQGNNVTGFGTLASDVLLILVSAAGVLSIIFIIIAGIKFLTSSGDEKKLASATGTLTYAIIGLAVTILAFVIIRVIQFFFGSNVTIT